jgi:hypothetical protein
MLRSTRKLLVHMLVGSSISFVGMTGLARSETGPAKAEAQWGVQLSGSFSEEQARVFYERARKMLPTIIPERPPLVVSAPCGNRGVAPFYRAQVGVSSRSEAISLCIMIRDAGVSCIVLPSRYHISQ